jgi:hypothetical protein
METAAGHPELRDIFNKIRTADQTAWAGGPHATRPKAFVDLSEADVEALRGRNAPLSRARPITARPIQLTHTAWGTPPAA